MNTNTYIGIDFGTTNTSVVLITTDEHGSRTRILGEDGKFPFASILAIDNTFSIKFGNEVKQKREFLSDKCKVISSFKSILGSAEKALRQQKATIYQISSIIHPQDMV